MKKLLWLWIVLLPVSGWADIYTWTDGNGVAHFSDKPHPGASELKLPSIQISPSSQTAHVNEQKPVVKNDLNKKHKQVDYENISIAQPTNEETIRNTQGYVGVMVQVLPELGSDDKVQMIYDGNDVGEPQSSLLFNINGMYRGSHTLAAKVIDAEGNTLISSEPITVFMMQPRAGMANGGSAK